MRIDGRSWCVLPTGASEQKVCMTLGCGLSDLSPDPHPSHHDGLGDDLRFVDHPVVAARSLDLNTAALAGSATGE
jgi:hypothetical protein